jgi:hypothetical protein
MEGAILAGRLCFFILYKHGTEFLAPRTKNCRFSFLCWRQETVEGVDGSIDMEEREEEDEAE